MLTVSAGVGKGVQVNALDDAVLCCAQPLERIEQDTERDNYMTAEEAKAYGLIDDVISQR